MHSTEFFLGGNFLCLALCKICFSNVIVDLLSSGFPTLRRVGTTDVKQVGKLALVKKTKGPQRICQKFDEVQVPHLPGFDAMSINKMPSILILQSR